MAPILQGIDARITMEGVFFGHRGALNEMYQMLVNDTGTREAEKKNRKEESKRRA
ncbi:hypothetical protein ACU8KH_04786 [Lachancea thermotolerans]